MTVAATAASAGGGVYSAGPLRPLFQMPDMATDFTGLATYFDRSEIEATWGQIAVNPEATQHQLMVPTAENDLVSAIHRDFTGRYSDRITRILAGMSTHRNHADESAGVINSVRKNLLNFESLSTANGDQP